MANTRLGCYNDGKKQLKQLFSNADPELGTGEITTDEVRSLFLLMCSGSSHFSLDTAGPAQDAGLPASEGFPARKLQQAQTRYFIMADTRDAGFSAVHLHSHSVVLYRVRK